MVAGLTADVFVQLTATLAHLSSTLNNKTNSDGIYPPLPLPPPRPPNRSPYDNGYRKGRKGRTVIDGLSRICCDTKPLSQVQSIPLCATAPHGVTIPGETE